MTELRGMGVALVTPFNQDGSIDFEGLKKLVNYNIENGTDYLVAMGTTAESATLTKEEKKLAVASILEANQGRLPVVIGIGGNNTAQVIDEIQAWDLSPFAAILSVSPFYNKPTQQGIYEHFKAISQATDKPIIVYNVPGRTASNMLPETTVRLAKACKNIVAVKEAANDIVQAMELIRTRPDGFLVISGDDMLTLPMVLAGGDGVISVIGQGFPADFSKMVRLGMANNATEGYALHYKLTPAIDMIFEQGNPAGIKAVLQQRGICVDKVRLPLVGVDADLGKRIASFTKDL
ncbi:MAG: 4-hydroxy-tetrahydrodipicolinate synthase [Gilvibacter sp.]